MTRVTFRLRATGSAKGSVRGATEATQVSLSSRYNRETWKWLSRHTDGEMVDV